jgi:hypothetical protein
MPWFLKIRYALLLGTLAIGCGCGMFDARLWLWALGLLGSVLFGTPALLIFMVCLGVDEDKGD